MGRRNSLRESSQLAMQVASLVHLSDNWDGKGGKAISPLCISRAIRSLKLLTRHGRRLPTKVVPMSNGGVRFEWGGVDVIFSYEMNPEDDDYDERREAPLLLQSLDVLEKVKDESI